MFPFERAFWPFCPRPAVLPRPEPTPRPMRRSLVTAPSGGDSFERMSRMTLSFDLLHRDEVHDLLDHPPERRRVRNGDLGAGSPQAEPLHDEAHGVGLADDAANLAHLELRFHPAPPSGPDGEIGTGCAPCAAARMCLGAISSVDLSRLSAICSAALSIFKALTVARTTLCGLEEPRHFERMSWMPADSTTARTAPPAMTPVPAEAGRNRTLPEPKCPNPSCGIELWRSGTLNMFLRAWSLPLRIASGTSLALPSPTPTCPDSSPTTTSAEKLKRRPPFTTLATRLMWITRSFSLSSSICSNAMRESPNFCEKLKFEPALARRVGEGADAAVVEVTVAIEDDPIDFLGETNLGDQRADFLGGFGLVSLVERALQVLGERRDVGEGAARAVVDDLGVDVLGRAKDGEARLFDRARDLPSDAQLAPLASDNPHRHGNKFSCVAY